jgi:hypothetical protein
MPKTGRGSLTRQTCSRRTLAQVIESWIAHMWACDIAFIRRILAEGGGLVAGPGEREMFERLAAWAQKVWSEI